MFLRDGLSDTFPVLSVSWVVGSPRPLTGSICDHFYIVHRVVSNHGSTFKMARAITVTKFCLEQTTSNGDILDFRDSLKYDTGTCFDLPCRGCRIIRPHRRSRPAHHIMLSPQCLQALHKQSHCGLGPIRTW